MPHSRAGVYDSAASDFIALFLPFLLALAVGTCFETSGLWRDNGWVYYCLMLLFDTPHLVTGLWVMGSSREARPALKLHLAYWAFAAVALYYAFTVWGWEDYGDVLLAHFAAWHFIRQQQAWFYLCAERTAHRWSARCNQIGINAATWGVFILGQCRSPNIGWYLPHDLAAFPSALFPWVAAACALGLAVHMVHQAYLTRRHGRFPLIPNLVWLMALATWMIARLTPYSSLGFCLIVIPHAMSYLFLLQRHVTHQGQARWGVWAAYLAGVGVQFYLYYPRLSGGMRQPAPWLIALTMGLTLAHFLHDKMFWSSQSNPHWRRALGAQGGPP